MRLAIEMSDDNSGYGRIHKAGCRDLRDPEGLHLPHSEDLSELSDVVAALSYSLGTEWTMTASEALGYMAPCARNARNAFDGTPYWAHNND